MNTIAAQALAILATIAAAPNEPAPNQSMPPTVAPGAKLVEVYADDRFFEGPSWDASSGKLLFTAFGKDNFQILRLEEPGKVSVWMDQTEGINGTYISNDNHLLGAQAYGHRVLKIEIGSKTAGKTTTLAADKTWHQPNDICQTPNGTIYFTDPNFKERKQSAVYSRTSEGKVTKVITDMPLPNGLLASNDGKTLYVADSHRKHWRAYPIRPNGKLGKGRIFFNPDTENQSDPDGMTTDEHGNLYFTGRGGVWMVSPKGKSLGFIPVPEFCSNATFGGADGKTLYLTCKGKVYNMAMTVRGRRFAHD